MRKNVIISIFCYFIILTGFCQKEQPSILDFDQRFVEITRTLYADKYEVTVKDYQMFLTEIKKKENLYSLCVYDSTLWRSFLRVDVEDYYYSHDTYRYHPIVGITYQAAHEFCNWLTEKYHSNAQRQYRKVLFRLPTKQEFIETAISHYDSTQIFYPWGNNELYNSKTKEDHCNYLELSQTDIDMTDNQLIYHAFPPYWRLPKEVGSYEANPFGVFDIVGNVSEMIQEESIAMGGNFISTGYNVRVSSEKNYKNADVTVGFRVYMEIKQND